MKTLGLIGGTSWVSTIDYYRIVNQTVNEKLGGLNSAKLYLYSVNFGEFKKLADENNWKEISSVLCSAAKKLEDAGAECIVICANTPHKVADQVRQAVRIPLIHIVEVTAQEINHQKIGKVELLGTKPTMEENFFKVILAQHKIDTLIPDVRDRAFIHRTIFNELGKGILNPETKAEYLRIINTLVEQGAKGIILGCTEIPLLIKQEDCSVPVFDTTVLHAKAAVEFAI